MAHVRLTGVAFGFSELVPLLARVQLELTCGFSALVGANGAGKTTLLRLIAGELRPDAGAVRVEPRHARIVTCAQEVAMRDRTIDAFARDDSGSARALRDRVALDASSLDRWTTLSPGERKRWQIGAALAAEPDVLLLDEPTNHVDVEARALLIDALSQFAGVGVIVSHDRAFIDALAHTIVRIENGDVRAWPAPFEAARAAWKVERREAVDAYEQARDRERARKRALNDLRRTHESAERSRSTSARMKNKYDSDARGISGDFRAARAEIHHGRAVAAARGKLERSATAIPDKPRAELGAELFVGFERAPRAIVATLDRSIDVGGRPLLRDVRLTIRRDGRVRIVGANGAGKTTLLLAIVAEMRLRNVGFLPQELAPEDIVATLDELRSLDPITRGRVLSLVASLGVDPSRLLASKRPSPGEARKLHLAKLLGKRVQALVLDEPTNHLDLPSIERLERALGGYPGALVLVTHDDAFARSCTTTTVTVADGGVV